ncbi:MAG: hypothetical protein CFE41_20055 [Burkholderiales bacterium PBB2]|nr:MAG: hypothetical protein CFE41_20055 [Burkholderiales bacterium PBB2]
MNTFFTHPKRNPLRRTVLAALVLLAASSQAAGPLYLNDKPGDPQPLRWDTTQGPIKVYTDVGVFTRKNDGSIFLSAEQANAITAFALQQWSSVATSTWRAQTDPAQFTPFTAVPSIGRDVNDAASAQLVYGQYNQGGFYVIYDDDGRVLEDFFGVPRDQVLGIAMPEIAEDRDGDGYPETIVKATALMNGWMVSHENPPIGQRSAPPADVKGARYAGVFTHEFGHAINLSHSQVNGQLAFMSQPSYNRDLYPGVPGCVAPVHHWLNGPAASHIDPKQVETMFPFIDPQNVAKGRSIGQEMSTVDRPDDIAGISNLYPTADYLARTGSIAGSLLLKDGKTGYSGINVVARNVRDPLGDAVSAMSGDQSQGKLGPDGRFRINNLKPGERYQLYIEEISGGGYPTRPAMLLSQAEYWNAGESHDPALDTPCKASAIEVQAGQVAQADIVFNGHRDGVQYDFIGGVFLSSLSEDGQRAGGGYGFGYPLFWDAQNGIQLFPDSLDLLASSRSNLSADGRKMLVEANFDGIVHTDPDGYSYTIKQMALWDFDTGQASPMGALSDECGLGGAAGVTSSYGFGMNAAGTAAVGYSGHKNADGSCVTYDWNTDLGLQVVPYRWTAAGGGQALKLDGLDLRGLPWMRADAISGDGRVVVGTANYDRAIAWVGDANPVDLTALTGSISADAVNYDGSRVPLATAQGMVMWNALKGTGPDAFTPRSSPKYCIDMPFISWDGIDHCAVEGAAWVEANAGTPPLNISAISDDGRVVLARAGDFFTMFAGFMWVEDIGWIGLNDFLKKQGVVEAEKYGLENPIALSGKGQVLMGGMTGVQATWRIDLSTAYVCRAGQSLPTRFPDEFRDQVKAGARMGRCEKL